MLTLTSCAFTGPVATTRRADADELKARRPPREASCLRSMLEQLDKTKDVWGGGRDLGERGRG
jgi:hypothetical protein